MKYGVISIKFLLIQWNWGNPLQREHTFKEVTLEDFLVKAGIVPEEDARKNIGAVSSMTFGGSMGMIGNVGPEFVLFSSSSLGNTTFSSPTSVLIGNVVDMRQGSWFDNLLVSFQSANVRNSQNSQLLKHFVSGGRRDIYAPNYANQTEHAGHTVLPLGLGGLSSPIGGGITASLNGGFSNPLSTAIPAFKVESPLSFEGTGTSQGSMPLSPLYPSGTNVPLRKRLAEGQLETIVE